MKRVLRIWNRACAVLLCAALASCGGGGGGSDPVIPGGGSGDTENHLLLTVLPGATETSADVSLQLLNVDPTLPLALVGGISAELSYAAWISFAGFTEGPALIPGGAVLQQTASGQLLISLEGVDQGTLGTLHFDLTGTGNTGPLAWDAATLIGVTGTVLPDRVLNTTGAELSN